MRANQNSYDNDVIAWANEQARLLRAGRFDALDIEHIADEIEDVGKSEQREFDRRVAVLVAHLLKWQIPPEQSGKVWGVIIGYQRDAIARRLKRTPSLKTSLNDCEWLAGVWCDAVSQAAQETGLGDFPESCPWTFDQIMNPDFRPAPLLLD
jgi:hypothetical protein